MYEPTNWSKGDKIKADKLNKIEGGIAGADASVYQMGGIISDHSGGQLDELTFELTYGDITQIPNYKSAVLRCSVMFIVNGEDYQVGNIDLPYIGVFGDDTQFGSVLLFGAYVRYFAVMHDPYDGWYIHASTLK